MTSLYLCFLANVPSSCKSFFTLSVSLRPFFRGGGGGRRRVCKCNDLLLRDAAVPRMLLPNWVRAQVSAASTTNKLNSLPYQEKKGSGRTDDLGGGDRRAKHNS